MGRTVDFLIYFETYEREYENALLVKWELNRRGYTVDLVNTIKNDYWRKWAYRPKVVVAHTVRNDRNIHSYATYFRYRANKIVDLQYEQVLSNSSQGSEIWSPVGKARNVYKVCWGEDSFSRLEKTGIDPRLLRITGPMQMDTLRPEFASYYMSKEELAEQYNIPKGKKWILFNSDFPILNSNKSYIKAAERLFPDIEGFIEERRVAQNGILEWMKNALDDNSEIVFIYRPHPGENPTDAVKELLEYSDRFLWISDYSVKQWISAVELVCVWNSTTIVESYFAQKPSLVLRPAPLRDSDDISLFSGADTVDSYEQFIDRIHQPFSGKQTFPIPDDNILRHYSYSKKQPAFVNVCDFLEDIFNDPNSAADYRVPLKGGYLKNEAKMSLLTFYASVSRATGIRLSRILPVKKRAFRNAERGSIDYSPESLRRSFELRLRPIYENAEKEEWGK